MNKSNKLRRLTLVANLSFITLIISTFFVNCAKPASQDDSSSAAGLSDVGASFSGQVISEMQYVSSLGEVWGFAYDPMNKDKSLKVIFYVDGPVGVGQYAGEVQASIQSIGPHAGHFFSYKLPARFADSQEHVLVAYAVEARSQYQLYPGSLVYRAYTPKAEAFYNQRVASFIQSSCTSCHTWSYMGLFAGPLTNPKPLVGGTATNNRLIQKMSGATSHGGGRFCNGLNDGVCVDIQRWWEAEFQ